MNTSNEVKLQRSYQFSSESKRWVRAINEAIAENNGEVTLPFAKTLMIYRVGVLLVPQHLLNSAREILGQEYGLDIVLGDNKAGQGFDRDVDSCLDLEIFNINPKPAVSEFKRVNLRSDLAYFLSSKGGNRFTIPFADFARECKSSVIYHKARFLLNTLVDSADDDQMVLECREVLKEARSQVPTHTRSDLAEELHQFVFGYETADVLNRSSTLQSVKGFRARNRAQRFFGQVFEAAGYQPRAYQTSSGYYRHLSP